MLKRVGDFLSRPLPAPVGSIARSLLPSQSTLSDGIAERIDEDRGKVLEERKRRRRELAIKSSDVSLEKLESPLAMLPPTLTRLDGYSKTGFVISGCHVPGSVLVCNDISLMWNCRSFEELRMEMFLPLAYLYPRPDILVLGTGKNLCMITDEFERQMHAIGLAVHVCDSRKACGTFNILSQEGRSVAGALIAQEWPSVLANEPIDIAKNLRLEAPSESKEPEKLPM